MFKRAKINEFDTKANQLMSQMQFKRLLLCGAVLPDGRLR